MFESTSVEYALRSVFSKTSAMKPAKNAEIYDVYEMICAQFLVWFYLCGSSRILSSADIALSAQRERWEQTAATLICKKDSLVSLASRLLLLLYALGKYVICPKCGRIISICVYVYVAKQHPSHTQTNLPDFQHSLRNIFFTSFAILRSHAHAPIMLWQEEFIFSRFRNVDKNLCVAVIKHIQQ